MKNVFILILVTVIVGTFVSCKDQMPNNLYTKAPIDSLISNWNNSWNNHDSTAVRNLFADDALLTDENVIALGVEEISLKMIHPNINVINNLKTEKLQEWSTNDRAGYTGTYELDVIVDGSVVAKPKGVFAINWIKTDDSDWKITTAVLYSIPQK